MNICALVLASVDGGEMHSEKSKYVHKICGRPVISWLSEALDRAGCKEQLYVVGEMQEQVRQVLGEDRIYVFQENSLGSGHSVLTASSFLEARDGCTLILPGNMPLLRPDTIREIIKYYEKSHCQALDVTTETYTPGRVSEVIRSDSGSFEALSEPGIFSSSEAVMHEVDTGIYCFDTALLLSTLGQIANRMEVHTDEGLSVSGFRVAVIIHWMLRAGCAVRTFKIPSHEAVEIVNRVDMETARRRINRRICSRHMKRGVTIENPDACYVEAGVKLGTDVHICSGSRITGNTQVGEGTFLGPGTFLENARVGNNCRIEGGSILSSEIGDDSILGFGSYIHQSTNLAGNVKIGSGVTLKNCKVGKMSEIGSRSFLSGVEVGESAFIGHSVASVDPLPQYAHRFGETDEEIEERLYSKIGSGAEIGALSRLYRPFEIPDKADLQSGSIFRSKKGFFPWSK